MKKLACIAVFSALGISGCASILNEKTQPINVSTSSGDQVAIKVDGAAYTAPGVINVLRENKNKMVYSDNASCAKETSIEKSVDPKFFINILSGGVFGSTTDYSTEKMWRYSENVVISCKK